MPFREAWLLIGGLLAFIGVAAGEPIITGVGFVVIVVGGLSRYWSRNLFRRVTLTATPSEHRAFVGEPVTLDVALANDKPLPLPWYEWRLALGEPLRVTGESLGSAAVAGLSWLHRRGAMGWYERRSWRLELRALERGYHQVGPAKIKSADLFGVFPREIDLPRTEYLTIYPQVFELPELGLPADRPFGEQRGGSPVFEDPLRISGLREYRPEDPMRRVDWKASARAGGMVSRVYEPAATRQLYVCLNIDTLEHSWEGYLKDELERLISTAASVAKWAAEERFAVGLLANGSYPNADRPIRLPPSRTPGQLTRILEALAIIQPLTMGDLTGTMLREQSRLPAGSTIVVVAALLPAALAGVLLRYHEGGNRVFVLTTTEAAIAAVPSPITAYAIGQAFSERRLE